MPHPSTPEAPRAHDAATSTAPLVGPASPPAPVIGWDVGGAHVKASLLEGGTVTAIAQWATPLWTGLEHLDAAIEAARARWPAFAHARHAVTMTAEMTDLFHAADRADHHAAHLLLPHLAADSAITRRLIERMGVVFATN